MALLAVHNLSKIYETNAVSVPALRNIELVFEQGEFTALVGPSGSGKTERDGRSRRLCGGGPQGFQRNGDRASRGCAGNHARVSRIPV